MTSKVINSKTVPHAIARYDFFATLFFVLAIMPRDYRGSGTRVFALLAVGMRIAWWIPDSSRAQGAASGSRRA